MSQLPPVLVVDDDKVTRELLRGILQTEGYPVDVASSGDEALKQLSTNNFPIILSDINMPGLDGLTLLSRLKESGSTSIVILMTGFGSLEGAVEAIHQGAFDYLSKPLRPPELRNLLSRAHRQWEAHQRTKTPVKAADAQLVPRTLIGRSPRMVQVYKMLAKASLGTSNVLIVGETGTGKELVAKAIHENSPFRGKSFVTVNCGALAENLLESELFGHVKGSFTGAVSNKRGLFEEAEGGTIFLDEIGDISPALQVKLLRVIQEGEFKPVGSNEVKRVETRVIAATHRNLEEYVKEGRFREDLYYRLKVILIELPPLRDRIDDLKVLVNHFLTRFSKKMNKTVNQVAPEAMEMMMTYAWPGNIRELEHTIERVVAMSNTNVIYVEDLPSSIRNGKRDTLSASPASQEAAKAPTTGGGRDLRTLEQVERSHILHVLQEVRYNKSRAAEILGIDRATLYRKAQRYGIGLTMVNELDSTAG